MLDLARFRELESAIARDRGDFVLFALVVREDVPDRWDLIISAPWVGDDKRGAVNYVLGEIKSRLGEQALIDLSRIVVADPQDARVRAFNGLVQVDHGGIEVRDTNLFGLAVKYAYIITSKRPPAPAAINA
jgi:hypothetical protein